jgi:hypothetical protein
MMFYQESKKAGKESLDHRKNMGAAGLVLQVDHPRAYFSE